MIFSKGVNQQFIHELEGLLNKYGVDALAWQNQEVIRLKGSGMEDEII